MLGPTSLLLWALVVGQAQSGEPGPLLEHVADLTERPGAVAVVGQRVFVALHPLGKPEVKLFEVRSGGRLEPYPSGVVARQFGAVTGLQTDGEGGLWILDAGDERKPPTVMGWNTVDERRMVVSRLSATALRPNSYPSALAVDRQRGILYVADRSRADWVGDSHPALLLHSLQTGFTRRVLADHRALEPNTAPVVIDRRTVAHRLENGTVEKIRLGAGQLALDAAGAWLYLGGLNCGAVWRVRTADLADLKLSAAELGKRVESFANRPPGTALLVDGAGRVVVTDVEQHGLAFVGPGGVQRWLTDPLLAWPDGLALAEGWLYLTVNQLNLHPALNKGEEESRAPYPVLRVQLPSAPPPRPAARSPLDAGVELDGGNAPSDR